MLLVHTKKGDIFALSLQTVNNATLVRRSGLDTIVVLELFRTEHPGGEN